MKIRDTQPFPTFVLNEERERDYSLTFTSQIWSRIPRFIRCFARQSRDCRGSGEENSSIVQRNVFFILFSSLFYHITVSEVVFWRSQPKGGPPPFSKLLPLPLEALIQCKVPFFVNDIQNSNSQKLFSSLLLQMFGWVYSYYMEMWPTEFLEICFPILDRIQNLIIGTFAWHIYLFRCSCCGENLSWNDLFLLWRGITANGKFHSLWKLFGDPQV